MKNLIIFIMAALCLAWAADQAQATLVRYYKLEDDAANTTVDDTSNTQDGTASVNTSNLSVSGVFGDAFEFNGTDEIVSCGSLTLSNTFTIALWVKLDKANDDGYFLSNYKTGGTWTGYNLKVCDDGDIFARTTGIDGDGKDTETSGYDVGDGNWHHVAYVVEPNVNAKIYIDGSEASAYSKTEAHNNTTYGDAAQTLYLGGSKGSFWEGCIDDVGIWDGEALGAEDINDIYHSSISHWANPGIAWDPDPDGTTIVVWTPAGPTLSWLPGEYVQDVNGHIVYFGTDQAAVTDANVSNKLGVYKGPNDVTGPDGDGRYSYQPGTLDYGQTYYWRIDEVNDPCLWPGDVWSFIVGYGKAELVSPADDATSVDSETVELLNWTAGCSASSHDVYFGTDYNEVADANDLLTPGPTSVYRVRHQALADVNYTPPEVLELEKTYYWRIDEVNASGEPQWPGDVWSFTTLDYLIIDNFNSYTGTGTSPYQDGDLRYTWKDWELNCSGATVYLETTIAQDGNSMEYTYENGTYLNVYYSEAERTYDTGQDWTRAGVEALVIHFYGDVDNDVNDTEQMYVGLKDTSGNVGIVKYDTNAVATYDGDANDLQKEEWQQWNIKLQDFNDKGVDLTDVNSIYIGFGDRANQPPEGGDGTVYFDDFRLYPPRCLGAMYKPLADIDTPYDCKVDFNDLEVMVSDWLDSDGNDEMTYRLVVYYDFETGSGTTAYDRSGSALHGTLDDDPNSDPQWTAGKIGSYALTFDGDGDYVDCGDDSRLDVVDNFTIAAWVKTTEGGSYFFSRHNTSNWKGYNLGVNADGKLFARMYITANGDVTAASPTVDDGNWHHLALVVEAGKSLLLYIDGNEPATYDKQDTAESGTYAGGNPLRIGRHCTHAPGCFNGSLDDVRFWDYALSEAEIEYLANESTGGFYHGLDSPANISDDEPKCSKIVNFRDFAALAGMWLDEKLFPPE